MINLQKVDALAGVVAHFMRFYDDLFTFDGLIHQVLLFVHDRIVAAGNLYLMPYRWLYQTLHSLQ